MTCFRQTVGAADAERELVDDSDLFETFGAALGLAPPWRVTSVELNKLLGVLEIGLDLPRGSRFACPHQGSGESACPVHDTTEKRWRHLDFFEHQAFLGARMPFVPGGPVHEGGEENRQTEPAR